MNENAIFPEDQHRQTRELLPWYINGTLDEREEALVEAHLDACESCREDLAQERQMVAALPAATAPLDVNSGWAAMRRKIEAGATSPALHDTADDDMPTGAVAQPTGNVIPMPARSFWRRPVPLGWALAAQAAALALVINIGVWSAGHSQQAAKPELYHTLSSPKPASEANLLVMFRPDLPESDMRSLLLADHAQVTGGPNLGGAYQLRVSPETVDATLTRMRGDPRITLAQPIDGSAQ